MRTKALILGAAVLVLGSTRAWAQASPVQATAELEQSLTITVNDDNLDCGLVLLTAPTVCTTPTSAQVHVVANSIWSIALEDLGGATGDAISLGAPTGRNGHFIINVTLSDTGGNATGGIDINITPTSIQSGSAAQALDETDDFGVYYGEALITLSPV